MAELEKNDIYACALPIPNPANPVCSEWITEIARTVNQNKNDQVYLVGHSLGSTAVLRYLENCDSLSIAGAILASGPSEKNQNRKIDNFLEKPFDFSTIKSRCSKFAVIHGDNDPYVPFSNAEFLARSLEADLYPVKNGGHLNGSFGILQLPEALDILEKWIQ